MARVVSAEESALRLDERGRWFHRGEPFENQKIISFFHRAIRKDAQGCAYLYNAHGDQEEHVYFEVEDTPYFVEHVQYDPDKEILTATLNTGAQSEVAVRSLEEDRRGVMYCRVLEGDRARFTEHALTELSAHAEMDEQGVYLPLRSGKLYVAGRDVRGA